MAHHYLQFNFAERSRLAHELAVQLEGDFELIAQDCADLGLPRFRQIKSDIVFRFILPGTYSMGLSRDEEAALFQLSPTPRVDFDSMRPVHDVTVRPFLISEQPVLLRDYRRIISDFANRNNLPESYPAYLTRSEAVGFASMLGCRLPTDAEWEYVCRATTTTLFVWGDHLPGYDELASWLDIDFEGPQHHAHNRFGLQGLFTGNWCLDHYSESCSLAKGDEEEFVCRGGGSYFWPWQDEEWVWCISAQRYSSSLLDDNRACGLFLTRDIV